MTDRVTALLASSPALGRASELTHHPRLPVLPALAGILPGGGLRPGTTVRVAGVGATSLALALMARASAGSWCAAVGLTALGIVAATELGVDLDHLVVVPDPGERWPSVAAAAVDAFDVVLACPPPGVRPHRLTARVRERDAVLIVVGGWPGADVGIRGVSAR